MTKTNESKYWTPGQNLNRDKEGTQTYRGYRIEVSNLGCEVPRILFFCETVAQAAAYIDIHINTLDARR